MGRLSSLLPLRITFRVAEPAALGAAFALLFLSKCRDQARVGRKERSDWSRQPGVIRSGSFLGALPRRQSPIPSLRIPLPIRRWSTHRLLNHRSTAAKRSPHHLGEHISRRASCLNRTKHALQKRVGMGDFTLISDLTAHDLPTRQG